MPRSTRFPLAIIALGCAAPAPLLAQDADEDLAAMRMQLAAMNARIAVSYTHLTLPTKRIV